MKAVFVQEQQGLEDDENVRNQPSTNLQDLAGEVKLARGSQQQEQADAAQSLEQRQQAEQPLPFPAAAGDFMKS